MWVVFAEREFILCGGVEAGLKADGGRVRNLPAGEVHDRDNVTKSQITKGRGTRFD